jgi:hypothetical protein
MVKAVLQKSTFLSEINLSLIQFHLRYKSKERSPALDLPLSYGIFSNLGSSLRIS